METLSVKTKEVVSANMIEVKVGTTGFCGGDAGHGGKTYLSIKNLASTDMEINVDGCFFEFAEHLEIELKGDSELKTFIEALEFVLKELKSEAELTKHLAKEELFFEEIE